MHNEFKRLGLERMCAAAGLGNRLHTGLPGPASATGTGEQVLIMDLSDLDDPVAADCLTTHRDLGSKVLLIVGDRDEEIVRAAAVDCDGYLDEATLTVASLADAVGRLDRGQLPMPPRMVRALLSQFRDLKIPPAPPTPPPLTEHESQVLRLLAAGCSNKQIARRMGISAHGTKRFVASILAKTNCRNRTMAVAKALRDGLCEPRQPA